jgi:hypothetical protein
MERLGSRTLTFYFSLQQGAGYPEKSLFLTRMIKELVGIVSGAKRETSKSHYVNNVSTAVHIYILQYFRIV